MVEDASACDNVTNFFCWMSCLPIPEPPPSASSSLSSSSLYCLDPRTFDTTKGNVTAAVAECTGSNGQPGTVHNDICTGQWQLSVDGLPEAVAVKENLLLASSGNDDPYPATTQFCYGGTSMYMDGFHWLGNTCVIYLFPEWIVTTSGALVGACFGTFFFAMALEGVIRVRRFAVTAIPIGTWRRQVVSATFYGLQLTMGYLVMLIVMTYSGPLFLSVVLGLMGGHVAFNADQACTARPSSTNASSPKKETATTPTPTTAASYGSTDERKPEEPSCCNADAENVPTTTGKGDDYRVPEGCTPCCQNTL
jgi:Ctr copper transporter family